MLFPSFRRRWLRPAWRFGLLGLAGVIIALSSATLIAPAIARPPTFSLAPAANLNQPAQDQLTASPPPLARSTGQQAEPADHAFGDRTGELGPPINQAWALQTLGFDRKAQTRWPTGAATGPAPDPDRLARLNLAQQWPQATPATDQAARQAPAAPDLGYQRQWQLGRLAAQQGRRSAAIAHYTNAFNSLPTVRQGPIARNQATQFAFQEQVEPVYRELVSLLLQEAPAAGVLTSREKSAPKAPLAHTQSDTHIQQDLQTARQVIESLQLATLENLFQAAGLDRPARAIAQVDPTAAIIYPIILADRLEVMLSLPGQPLSHYTTQQSQAQVAAAISQMRQSLRSTSFTSERLAIAQQLYRWLVQPAAADLTRLHIKTLVFALEGDLQNLPMGALHNGQQYLIEQYSVAVTPSLQLFVPVAAASRRVLIGGLSEANQSPDHRFAALPAVLREINQIKAVMPATVLLNQAFTTEALQTEMQTAPVSILHLATHGQFSAKPEETFILTWNGRLNFRAIETLLSDRKSRALPAIDLLVLSACQTAKGDQQAALGLAGVAVRSGARSTLASLWKVNDESTAQFMAQFYQALVQPGVSKAEAVRKAQLNLIQTPQFSHPYYWAPFILVGNWL